MPENFLSPEQFRILEELSSEVRKHIADYEREQEEETPDCRFCKGQPVSEALQHVFALDAMCQSISHLTATAARQVGVNDTFAISLLETARTLAFGVTSAASQALESTKAAEKVRQGFMKKATDYGQDSAYTEMAFE